MNKQFKNMLASFGIAFLVAGLVFVPSAAADNYYTYDHFNGTYSKQLECYNPDEDEWQYCSDGFLMYDSLRDAVLITGAYEEKTEIYNRVIVNGTTSMDMNVTQFGFEDESVKSVTVNQYVNLTDASNVFSKFVNADFYYLNNTTAAVARDIMGPGKTVSLINASSSDLIVSTGSGDYPAGESVLIDTAWASEGQKVKVAVQPYTGYSVYGWQVFVEATGAALPAEDYLVKSDDPEDGATTYILTMPAFDVQLKPLMRDQGSTIVTYVFLDADTYVMEVPADFNIKKVNVPVAEKMVNLTDCELLDGHVLSVELDSQNGYYDVGLGFDTFVMKNIAVSSSLAGYTIDEKKIYKNATTFTPITLNGVDILSTSGMTPAQVDEKISEGNMKTELQFTLKGVAGSALGKYKDQLTFTVSIDE